MKKTIMMLLALLSGAAYSEVLLKADFSGAANAPLNSIAAGDGQLTVHADVSNSVFGVLGGTAGTTNWQYNTAGDALLNTDLYTTATWGGPTRFDLGLELAAAGQIYTITNIEVDVVASNATDVSFDLWYALGDSDAFKANTSPVVIPAGTTGTFSLDTAINHLIANDTESTWYRASGDLRLGFYAADGGNVDSIEIGEIRVNGTVGPKPAASTNTLWNFNTIGDTEGWSQEWTDDIVGLGVSNAVSGSEVVLTAAAISGNDPNLVLYRNFIPALGFWDTAVIRVRQLNSGGTPIAWDSSGCAVVLGDTVVSGTLGGAGWDVVNEANEWIVASIDITSLSTNELDYIRFDPVGQFSGTNKNFEVDYIQLTSTATDPGAVTPDNSYWEFNTNGDLEGWVGNGDIVGLDATNGVLSSQSISGNDPQLIGPSVSPATWYWTTAEVRVRQLTTGGTPLDWESSGCSVVINGTVLPALGGGGWDVETQGDKWIVAMLDISQFESDDIATLRIDPVGSAAGTNKNFQIDYIRLNKAPAVPPPAAPQFAWEFNTGGDFEGWSSGVNGHITAIVITNSLPGSESVLASQGITAADPQLNGPAPGSPGSYTWGQAELRMRQIDSATGTGLAWVASGAAFVINGANAGDIGGAAWDVTTESDGWIVTTLDLASYGSTAFTSLRVDPVGQAAATNKNFEVDYIRLSTVIPPTKKLVQSWEFNSGSVEGFTGLNVTGLTAADAVNGSEKVLTSSDLTSIDAQVLLPFDAALSPGGVWDTMEFRFRQLNANPPGGTSQAYDSTGTLLFINQGNPNASNLGVIQDSDPDYTVTVESDGWISVVADISYLVGLDLTNFRFDPVGGTGSDAKNFEVDWIRLYALQPTVGYDAWTFLNGLSGDLALSSADADLDTFDNFYEYAFGGNPIDDMDIGLFPHASVVNVGSNVLEYISYQRSDTESGVDYGLVASDNLVFSGFSDLTESVDYTVVGAGAYTSEMDAVTNHVPLDLSVEFIRTKASQQ